jgi:predicted nucleotide-binding protein (sugar kinase/HSP70/actin superfamily)
MFQTWGPRLGVTEDECEHAHREGVRALAAFEADLQVKGRAILETVEAENRVAILMVSRPYHSDPGLNHGIPEEFQVLGYPILSIRSIPRDMEFLSRYFKEEVARGQHPLDINDVWPENYSANSAQKVWGVKFASRHPNVVLLDLSSFKCGHDAPTYGIIESIVSASATPYQALHDIDANKPGGSIKIRVKTYAHSLKLYEEALDDIAKKKSELAFSVDQKRLELMKLRRAQLEARRQSDPELDAVIAALAEKLRQYEAPPTKPEPPKGLVQLKKKTAHGETVPAGSAPTAAVMEKAQ